MRYKLEDDNKLNFALIFGAHKCKKIYKSVNNKLTYEIQKYL